MKITRIAQKLRATGSRTRSAFSLLELMLVVAIIGILMGVVAWNLAGAAERAKRRATIISMKTIKGALAQYNTEQSAYPPDLRYLVTAKVLEEGKNKDGWDRDFYYAVPGLTPDQPYQLISMGSDGLPGTPDDIDIWTVDLK